MIALAVVALAAIAFAYLLHRSHQAQAREWAKERGTLLTRIQHPQVVIAPDDDQRELVAIPERKVDPYAERVGQVDISDDWLNATDG